MKLSTPSLRRSGAIVRNFQSGVTLIELMVSITLGLMLVAGLASLIAAQSAARTEIDKTGALIENGRYASNAIASDLQLAGYWGDISILPAVPAALPNPCATDVATLQAAIPEHIQGYVYSNLAALQAGAPTLEACLPGWVGGTGILVVRHLDTKEVNVASTLIGGQVYMQTGLNAAGTELGYVIGAPATTGPGSAGTFNLLKKDGTAATLRKYLTNIYYIASTGSDGTTVIPTLKMATLSATGTSTAMAVTPIAEGIENLQIDYGVDTDNDGAPNGSPVNGTTLDHTTWPNVMGITVTLLARAGQTTPGYSDTKAYQLGSTAAATPAKNDGYQRHVFSQTVRMVNPSGRRI